MDLAQNTKKTSEEVKGLRHLIWMIKHDLQKNMKVTTINQKTINPFADNRQAQLQYDQMLQNTDQLQNQLTITDKVKKTLE